ncbi:hypothetical protein F5B20DRAFT_98067 [Whalleya microplaca]|nr:hypothetical protein F5B20DRAFT_98067 [Whalleya microplaca]
MKSWSLFAVSLLAAQVFGRALPVPSDQDASKVIRSDESENPVRRQRGGNCGHDEQSFSNVSACRDVCNQGGRCLTHTTSTGVGTGGIPVTWFECLC